MDIVFFTGGTRKKALLALIENGINVIAVVCPRPSKANSRFLDVIIAAHEHGIPVITVTKESIYEAIKSLKFDVLVSCGFSYILNEQVIKCARILAINIHPTLLPKYRGFRSGPYILINGEKKSGVTIHELTTDMDRGDIFLQREFEISPFDTTKSVFRKAQDLEPQMLVEFFNLLKTDSLKRIPQDESNASAYNNIRTPKDSLVDANKSLFELYNFIRSCDSIDYPAYFYIENEKVCIKLWRPNNQEQDTI